MSAVINKPSDGAVLGRATARRLDIQGLRAVAVLVVVLNHIGVTGFGGGFVGVDVFFVISGYVITRMLLRDGQQHGRVRFLDFYAKRARRIVPAATLIIVLTVIAVFELTNFLRGARVLPDATAASLFLANLHFIASGSEYAMLGADPSPLQHYWSLAVEEQFYLVWPVAIALTTVLVARTKLTLRPVLLVVLVVVTAASYLHSIVLTADNATAAFYSPLTRFWELAIGCVVAVVAPYLAPRIPVHIAAAVGWAGIIAIAVSVVTMSEDGFPGAIAAIPVLGAAAVIVAGIVPTQVGPAGVLGMAVPRYIGDISYSLYLVHWPICAIVAARYGADFSALTQVLLLVATFAGSAAMYHAFEDPIRRSRFLAARPWASLAIIPACIAIVFAVAAFERYRWAIDVPLVQHLF
ncbi:acyltransferase family protein [Gordonia pseudamarae]|uniref:Acyltransferase family protein n=1 Tax=Gordonia pseudamarae TaxID=2831662 RepID=A0ABX6II70_9ACTN|nr:MULTISPECIES: acyltransferase [Gordonia]MBD0024044.1 acyltransferase [Gordonia sp. (in: high G+C Gram-positive bacteria)]QHN26651.1 acyltransferase family protein [Gordonia pseudamarae]QHN35544.1 acyltransferase family protein [Gordonia pseudamarae]